MSDNKEAGRLILADLKMFNAATVLFEQEVQPAFMEALGETLQSWAEKRDWHPENFLTELYSWLAPRAWCIENKRGEDDANPWFMWTLKTEDDGDSNSYALADLCGVGTGISAFWFSYEIQGNGWKKAARSIREKYADRLKSLGFSVFDNEKTPFYLPLQLDASKLADAWMNDDYDELMEPLVTALENLERAVPIFDEFMQELRSLIEK